MRITTASILGIAALVLTTASCGGDHVPTGPRVAPLLSRIVPQTRYYHTFDCSAGAENSTLNLANYQDGVLVRQSISICTARFTETDYDSFTYDIRVKDAASQVVKECVNHAPAVTHTGTFSCTDKRSGLSAVLTVQVLQ